MKIIMLPIIALMVAGCSHSELDRLLFGRHEDGGASNEATRKLAAGDLNSRTKQVNPNVNAFFISAYEDDGGPWVWIAVGGQFVSSTFLWYADNLLSQGVSIAFSGIGESYGDQRGLDAFQDLYEGMVQRGYSKKPVLICGSRGGLQHYNWASRHPDCVAAIAGIYPVCDMRSWPGIETSARVYGVTQQEMIALLPTHNPINILGPIASRRIPILHLHGDADEVVPLQQNSAELKRRYNALGGVMTLSVIHGGRHENSPAFNHSDELLQFMLNAAHNRGRST